MGGAFPFLYVRGWRVLMCIRARSFVARVGEQVAEGGIFFSWHWIPCPGC